MFLTLLFKKLKVNLTKEKKGYQTLVIKETYSSKEEKKEKKEKTDKGKEKKKKLKTLYPILVLEIQRK